MSCCPLSREERSTRMNMLGVALSAVEHLPAEQKKFNTRKPSKAVLKTVKQQKLSQRIDAEEKRDRAERENIGKAMHTLNSRLSVFDIMIGQEATPGKGNRLNWDKEVEIESVSTPCSSIHDEDDDDDDDDDDDNVGQQRARGRSLSPTRRNKSGAKPGEAVIPAHSPQRFNNIYQQKVVPVLHHDINSAELRRCKGHVYTIRVDFWSELDLNRLQSVHGFSNHNYGKEPIFVEMQVPGACTPHEFINTLLSQWGWDNCHSYRISSNVGLGLNRSPFPDSSRHYEAEAFSKAKDAPVLASFMLNKFSRMTVDYDLDGNKWQWQGIVSDVELNRKLDHIIVVEKGGGSPCQYAHQLMDRYIMHSPTPPVERRLKRVEARALLGPHVRSGSSDGDGDGDGKEEQENSCDNSDGVPAVDMQGKYYKSSKDHVDRILLGKYRDNSGDRQMRVMLQQSVDAALNRPNGGDTTNSGDGDDSGVALAGRLQAISRQVHDGLAY